MRLRHQLAICASVAIPVAGQADEIWTEHQYIQPAEIGPRDHFGTSVAVDGDIMVIGVPEYDVGANINDGAAYVYRFDGTEWVEEALLVAPVRASNEYFGSAVDISGDVIVVGVPRRDTSEPDAGAVEVFRRDGSTWAHEVTLLAKNPSAGGGMGHSVAIDGNWIVCGAYGMGGVHPREPGSAHVFHLEESVWTYHALLLGSDAGLGEQFGWSVAISDEVIVVGARLTFDEDRGTGSAYVFEQFEGTWSETDILLAEPRFDFQQFGTSVSVDGDRIAVWMSNRTSRGDNPGRVHIFEKKKGYWPLHSVIQHDGAKFDNFGIAVDLEGGALIVGAPNAAVNGRYRAGQAYLYLRFNDTWRRAITMEPSDSRADLLLGASVAISDRHVVAGAPEDNLQYSERGQAYTFITPQIRLAVESECPDKGTTALAWQRGTPNGRVALIYSPDQGASVIPDGLPCAGSALRLSETDLRLLWSGFTDSQGEGRLRGLLPDGVACGGHVQLIDLTQCATSNVARIDGE